MKLENLFRALSFAATKHRDQRRKDEEASPYINHPVAVATVLVVEGGVEDEVTLMGALLHDTVEDTETTFDELREHFGEAVMQVVKEMTDDKSLPKEQRKQFQIDHAPGRSDRAKQIKICDKICNLRDIVASPPANWSLARKQEYLAWTQKVVAGCHGVNPRLDAAYDETVRLASRVLG